MSRLIDADALMKDLEKWLKQVDPTHPQEDNAIPPMEDIIVSTLMTIDEQPTIEERKTGKWIWQWDKFDIDTANEAVCSKCKKISAMPVGYFCKWCGADMRGEEHETD